MAGRRRRPRGHIEQLPSGSFRAKVYAGIDPLTGKRRYLVETARSHNDAELALTVRRSAVRSGWENCATGRPSRTCQNAGGAVSEAHERSSS